MARTATPYSTPGRYRSGVWLVVFPNGSAGLYGKRSLPQPTKGVQYYWLGGTASQAGDRLYSALPKFPQTSSTEQIPIIDQTAFNSITAGKPVGIAGNPPITPFQAPTTTPTTPGTAPGQQSGLAPGATYPQGPLDGIAQAITSVLDFLKLIAWLFAPKNLLRAVEFLTGIVLMIFGLWAAIQARGERVEGFTTSESAISRSGLGRVSRELAANQGGSIRPRSAPHTTRRDALRVRYEREQQVSRRRENQRRGLTP